MSHNEDEDVSLGRKLRQVILQERLEQSSEKHSDNFAKIVLIIFLVLGLITFILINTGGPK